MKRIFEIFAGLLFPEHCASCGEIIEPGERLCPFCREALEICDPLKRCMHCGLKKGDCGCKTHIYCFDGCIAPFYHTTAAKQAIYGLKFGRRVRNVFFLAEQMALSVRTEYSGIAFDGVCFVPMSRKRRRKRGFNQSELLAKELARILEIEVISDLLYCRHSEISQHDISLRERRKHVKGLYFCRGRCDGKTLLLVDDIKTTGSTLNECAKQLFSAGADCVYCVTASLTKPKSKVKTNKTKK